jgi:hypothetical protein
MRTWMIAPIFAVSLALAGCEPPLPAVPPGAPVVVTPMKLVQKSISPPPTLITLAADGTLTGPNGAFLGKVAGTKIVDKAGKEVASVAADGTITTPDVVQKVKFTPEGYVSADKGTIKIGSDGTVLTQASGTDTPTRTDAKWEGYTPASARAAELVLVYMSKHLGKVADLGLQKE